MAIKKPDFPGKYAGEVNAMPYGNHIVTPNLIASIPIYTLIDDPEEREIAERGYNERKEEERREAIEFYNTVNVGDVYWAGVHNYLTARISKISVKDDVLYINLCATEEQKEHCKKAGIKPIKPIKWQFEVFQSLVKSKKLQKYEAA